MIQTGSSEADNCKYIIFNISFDCLRMETNDFIYFIFVQIDHFLDAV